MSRRSASTEQATIERLVRRIDDADHVVRRVGDGPPLVLVHGLGGSWRWWARNIPGLAERFTVHLVDLTGFGENRRGRRFSLAHAPAHLAALVQALDTGPVALVGHSMGGAIALRMAADHPTLVTRLVLVSPALLPEGYPSPRQVLGLAQALRLLPAGFLPTMASDFARCGPLTLMSAGRQLMQDISACNLTSVAVPTLIVWGERDTVVPLSVGREVARQLPSAHFEVLPGVGHVPMWERPDAFNHLVIEFAADGDAPAAMSSGELPRTASRVHS